MMNIGTWQLKFKKRIDEDVVTVFVVSALGHWLVFLPELQQNGNEQRFMLIA